MYLPHLRSDYSRGFDRNAKRSCFVVVSMASNNHRNSRASHIPHLLNLQLSALCRNTVRPASTTSYQRISRRVSQSACLLHPCHRRPRSPYIAHAQERTPAQRAEDALSFSFTRLYIYNRPSGSVASARSYSLQMTFTTWECNWHRLITTSAESLIGKSLRT